MRFITHKNGSQKKSDGSTQGGTIFGKTLKPGVWQTGRRVTGLGLGAGSGNG